MGTFLANVISKWTPTSNQSNSIKSSDLQVAKYKSGFTMFHKMGLVKITLGTKSVYSKWMNYVNGDKSNYYANSSGTTITTKDNTITASNSFVLNIPSLINGNYYAVIKDDTDVIFSSSSTGQRKWTNNITANIQSGRYKEYTAAVNWSEDWLEACYLYSYTGYVKSFTLPYTGSCFCQCWGGRGGTGLYNGAINQRYGGLGGYTSGYISMSKNDVLYIYVGGKGVDGAKKIVAGGWNGGGEGDWDHSDDESSGGGGGATDIRLEQCSSTSAWSDVASLCSRIMVAGGGGGGRSGAASSGTGGAQGGVGGNTTGGNAYNNNVLTNAIPGSQKGGNQFGKGEDGRQPASNYDKAGGGGGYYGGASATIIPNNTTYYTYPGAGGSSFISGYSGCDAIAARVTSLGDISHTGSANHYSGKTFTSGVMKSGAESQPKTGGATGTQTGNDGDGYASITIIPDE